MARLAFLTFGLMRAPTGDPAVRGFEIRIAATYERAAESPGFLGSFAEQPGSGGVAVRPARWADPAYAARSAITMTLWTDLESVHAFAFGPAHSGVLRRGHAWMEHGDWPRHVAWWVDDDEMPDPRRRLPPLRPARRARARLRTPSPSTCRTTPTAPGSTSTTLASSSSSAAERQPRQRLPSCAAARAATSSRSCVDGWVARGPVAAASLATNAAAPTTRRSWSGMSPRPALQISMASTSGAARPVSSAAARSAASSRCAQQALGGRHARSGRTRRSRHPRRRRADSQPARRTRVAVREVEQLVGEHRPRAAGRRARRGLRR